MVPSSASFASKFKGEKKRELNYQIVNSIPQFGPDEGEENRQPLNCRYARNTMCLVTGGFY